MRIAVVALGKIGLPLAVQFATKGHDVFGYDINPEVVRLVNAGETPFPGETDLDIRLAAVAASGSLTATTNCGEAVGQAETVVVVVPLVVDADGLPDFGSIDAATRDIGQNLRPGTLVTFETTLPVGTTRTRFAPLLAQTSGLTIGQDLFVAFSPERVFTGRVFADLRRYPKLIGGVDEPSARRAEELYQATLDFDERADLKDPNGVWDLGSADAAEMAKLAETTYRDVNIALANQFARYADSVGIDIYNVIAASNSQPFSHIHQPGIAVGGHCIPVYPRFYLWNDPDASVVSAAREANSAMPQYAVDLLQANYGSLNGARVTVLGAAYRGGVKETAFSGVFPTVAALERAGAIVKVHDPLFDDAELRALGFDAYEFGQATDAAIVQADHEMYQSISSEDLPGVKVLVDGRRVTKPAHFPGVTWREIGGSASRGTL
ncbi:MAG: nucleotide sugar dehydrogenase [Candidatus Nanopelagicales bacterium]